MSEYESWENFLSCFINTAPVVLFYRSKCKKYSFIGRKDLTMRNSQNTAKNKQNKKQKQKKKKKKKKKNI